MAGFLIRVASSGIGSEWIWQKSTRNLHLISEIFLLLDVIKRSTTMEGCNLVAC
jgi:hypothetical protein